MGNFLAGKKTYLVGLGMIAFGIIGMMSGFMDTATAGQKVLEGLGLITLRQGVAKVGQG